MAPLRTNLLAVILIGAASVAAAQPLEEAPRLRQFTQGNPPFFRFRIVDGRVVFASRNIGNFQSQNSYGDGRKESINLASENGRPRLQYERTTRNEQLVVNASSGNTLSISRTPRGTASFTAVEFKQISNEKVTLIVGTGDRRQVFRAADLWRLAILQPKECRDNLFPLFDLLRPDWKVATMTERVETSLLTRARVDVSADRARWAVLVEQLGDDQFTKREAADRALRAGAASAVGYLRQLDLDRLDAEQQFRVRRIIATLGGKSEDDTAEEVAASLLRDGTVWLALLGRPEAETRKTAARQLAALFGEPIGVDPAAAPETQKAQREKLRARIEKK
jgi:hypothetical protein